MNENPDDTFARTIPHIERRLREEHHEEWLREVFREFGNAARSLERVVERQGKRLASLEADRSERRGMEKLLGWLITAGVGLGGLLAGLFMRK